MTLAALQHFARWNLVPIVIANEIWLGSDIFVTMEKATETSNKSRDCKTDKTKHMQFVLYSFKLFKLYKIVD